MFVTLQRQKTYAELKEETNLRGDSIGFFRGKSVFPGKATPKMEQCASRIVYQFAICAQRVEEAIALIYKLPMHQMCAAFPRSIIM